MLTVTSVLYVNSTYSACLPFIFLHLPEVFIYSAVVTYSTVPTVQLSPTVPTYLQYLQYPPKYLRTVLTTVGGVSHGASLSGVPVISLAPSRNTTMVHALNQMASAMTSMRLQFNILQEPLLGAVTVDVFRASLGLESVIVCAWRQPVSVKVAHATQQYCTVRHLSF